MSKVLVHGATEGTVLKSEAPINFLGTVDKESGMVKDGNHELSGRSVRGTVLVFPSGIGSSVGAYTIYSIKSNGSAPLAMVCKKADLAVATGCALADIPLIISEEAFASLETGQQVILDTRAEDMIRRR